MMGDRTNTATHTRFVTHFFGPSCTHIKSLDATTTHNEIHPRLDAGDYCTAVGQTNETMAHRKK